MGQFPLVTTTTSVPVITPSSPYLWRSPGFSVYQYTALLCSGIRWYTPIIVPVLPPPYPPWGGVIPNFFWVIIEFEFRSTGRLPYCGIPPVSGWCRGSTPMSPIKIGGCPGRLLWRMWRNYFHLCPPVPGSVTSAHTSYLPSWGWTPLIFISCTWPWGGVQVT